MNLRKFKKKKGQIVIIRRKYRVMKRTEYEIKRQKVKKKLDNEKVLTSLKEIPRYLIYKKNQMTMELI